MSKTSNVAKVDLIMKLMPVATLRQAALHGLPAKETTRRQHEWFGFVHVWPMPLVKHFDLIRGFIVGGRILWTGGSVPLAQPGNEIEAIAQIDICNSVRLVGTSDHSGEISSARDM